MVNNPNGESGYSTQGDDFNLVFASAGMQPSVPVVGIDESALQGNLASLSSEFQVQVQAFTAARQANDEAGADEALRKMESIKRQVKALKECSSVFGAASGQEVLGSRSAGLTLSHRDLPKFQHSSCVRLPFPDEEAFASVEHFLTRFKNIIKGSAYGDIELVWRKFLPLCLPYSDHAWIESELSKCRNWPEARALFKEHHGSNLATRHYTDMVFTMQMGPRESISDYSKKFLEAVYNAGLPSNDPRIADRFLASLTLPVRTLIRVTVARVGRNKSSSNEDWTIEYITQVGRDILGDDPFVYREATALIPGANRTPQAMNNGGGNSTGNSHGRTFHKKHTFPNKVSKSYFCKHHGKNGTHNSKDCFSLKKQGKSASNNSCYKCKKPWIKGHRCGENKLVLAIARGKAEGSSEKENNEENLMEDLSYNCKYPNTENKNESNEMFNLLIPIIIENQKLMGRTDTGSDISFINSNIFYNKYRKNTV